MCQMRTVSTSPTPAKEASVRLFFPAYHLLQCSIHPIDPNVTVMFLALVTELRPQGILQDLDVYFLGNCRIVDVHLFHRIRFLHQAKLNAIEFIHRIAIDIVHNWTEVFVVAVVIKVVAPVVTFACNSKSLSRMLKEDLDLVSNDSYLCVRRHYRPQRHLCFFGLSQSSLAS